jgi:tetratricopeptide (TPR) repeat protein
MYQTIGALGWLGQRERVHALRERLELAGSAANAADPAYAGWVNIADWSIALMGDDLAMLVKSARDATSRFREAGDRLALGTALGCSGVSFASVGALPEAEATLREGLELAERIASERVRSSCLAMLSHVLLLEGRGSEALAAAEQVAGSKNFFNSSFATVVAALAELDAGRISDARTRLEPLLERVVVLPGQHAAALTALSLIELEAGNHSAALAAADRALELAERAGTFAYFRSAAWLVRVEARTRLGDRDGARNALRDASERLRKIAGALEPFGHAETFVSGLRHHACTFALAREQLGAGA